MNEDPLSPELRVIENEVDNAYLSNPLGNLHFATAAWYIMSVYENISINNFQESQNLSEIDAKAFSDTLIVGLQYPLRWFWSTSSKLGSIPNIFNSDLYEAALDMLVLSIDYRPFESAYTLASRKLIDLTIEGDLIKSDRTYINDFRYEAYDVLRNIKTIEILSDPTSIYKMISKSITISDNRFYYQAGRRLVTAVIDFLTPLFKGLYELPNDWKFDSYSITDFRSVTSVLMAISFIHFMARSYAIQQGVNEFGFLDSLYLVSKEKLTNRITRYSNVDSLIVESIISTLTYGSCEIKKPDPALQPLIPLNDKLAIMPRFLLNSSIERNFISLLNRIPKEQKQYLRLVDSKEKYLIEQIRLSLKELCFDYYHGYLPNRKDLPDIDLAIICHNTKAVILIELKWFICPSETREVIEKGEEIKKGVDQQLRLRSVFELDPTPFYSCLSIDKSYIVEFIVISQNSIGPDWAQHTDIPVINSDHVLENICELKNLRETTLWLKRRDYLPIENKDYKVYEGDYPIVNWKLRWSSVVSAK